MKTEVIRILEKRVEDFEKIHHSYEAREVRSAIDTIKRLIPPELFSIPVVSKSFVCGCDKPEISWYGIDDNKKYFCFSCQEYAN